ncbi:hypothetical protein HAX54_017553 [Datura stramonium]|uniref:Uncharacterized protein n=1 Tax=Datura stramonium TaxID=4076 RepID=A0ABS8UMK7_DATST|nr:hypothetical protein [Datura stramonium]
MWDDVESGVLFALTIRSIVMWTDVLLLLGPAETVKMAKTKLYLNLSKSVQSTHTSENAPTSQPHQSILPLTSFLQSKPRPTPSISATSQLDRSVQASIQQLAPSVQPAAQQAPPQPTSSVQPTAQQAPSLSASSVQPATQQAPSQPAPSVQPAAQQAQSSKCGRESNSCWTLDAIGKCSRFSVGAVRVSKVHLPLTKSATKFASVASRKKASSPTLALWSTCQSNHFDQLGE